MKQMAELSSHRGSTTVNTGVYSKIAAQAAYKVPVVGSAAGGILGLGKYRDFDSRPKAKAEVLGNMVVIDLDLGLSYPSDVQQACEDVRNMVAADLRAYLGVEQVQTDIRVSWMSAPDEGTRNRRLR
ncbi:Asp23/Gls24 family envelope stress response protein [Glutamicibacter halophytocola]|uniref:Asp23/Gls24 family envelope stress response protein n=1 Tax=Glutamicibacter halophytocola TaxID=1933880 RepID=A0ABX5YAN9_9MICC|nr:MULTISPECIES: Asp23/Gls24 family envelope stress response protein [Glutamicibacter]MBF6670336.1 Asp23/Gls24 family envelope stress response protein [Glutamicibacter sp. FBE19]QDY66733.1 Asp23/Gls24 family envelope stress response protein [Glutamicibacter halophytocola]